MRRKGEFNSVEFNQGYPFQVAFPEGYSRDIDRGARFYRSHAPRPQYCIFNQQRHVIIGFADEADLIAFMRHAGGMRVEPQRFGRPRQPPR